MSLASTSRALPLSTRAARAQWVAGLCAQQRGFAASALAAQEQQQAKRTAKPTGPSVQAADKQTKDRERMLRRMPAGIDASSYYDRLIFEPTVDPAFKLSWIIKTGGLRYTIERLQRWYATKKFTHEAGLRGMFPGLIPRRGALDAVAKLFRSPARTYPELLPTLEDVYVRYQAAQAAGDVATVNKTSIGAARDRAAKVAGSMRGGKWELIKHNASPRILSVRAGALDLDEKELAVQVVVKYNTLQRLTHRGQTRTVNVVENVVFDKREQGTTTDFVIKDTVEEAQPEFLTKKIE